MQVKSKFFSELTTTELYEILKAREEIFVPVAIGLYLPLELSTTIMIGGIICWVTERTNKSEKNKDASSGILYCSGMIAGEGLIGILLAVLAVAGVTDKMDLSAYFNSGDMGGMLFIILVIIAVLRVARKI